MNRWIALVSCVALTACGGSRSTPAVGATSGSADGVYEFNVSVPAYEPGKTLRVQGTLTVLGDSLIIQSPNSCEDVVGLVRYMPKGMPSANAARGFNCGGAWFSFNRRDPVKSATWYATVPIPKQRNACAEYRVNDARRQVCVRWRPETYYEYQSRSGSIPLRLIQ